MNKKSIFIIILCSVLSVPSALAEHAIAFSLLAGEHSWVGHIPDSKINGSMGVAAGFGISYELRQRHFLFTFGAIANLQHSAFNTNKQLSFWADDGDPASAHAYNPEGIYGNFTYQYDFFNRKDQYTNVAVQVPLMFGAQWKSVYFLLGGKFQTAGLWSQDVYGLTMNSRGIYAGMYGDSKAFTNMPEHGFFTGEVYEPVKRDVQFNLNAYASAEVGWVSPVQNFKTNFVSRRGAYRFKVGLYFDYGLLNDVKFNSSQLWYTTPQYNPATANTEMKNFTTLPILDAQDRAENIRPMQIGIRLSILFLLPRKQVCFCNFN